MRAKRVDTNHADLVAHFRSLGASVQSLAALGKGVPDLLIAVDGINWLVEIKYAKGKETPDQREWFAKWQGGISVVRDKEGAERLVRQLRERYEPSASNELEPGSPDQCEPARPLPMDVD